MNRYYNSLFVVVAALLAGFAAGVSIDSWSISRTAAARPQELQTQPQDEAVAPSSMLDEGSRTLAKIVAMTTPSVVHIQSERRAPERGVIEETGSGVIMTCLKSSEPFVVTNGHVVGSAELDEISVHLHDGRIVHPTSKREDKDTDLAFLTIDVRGLEPAAWGDSDRVDIGHMVLAMGSPFGLSRSVTYGIISAKQRRSLQLGSNVLNQDFLQTDAAINPGNSGGPLFDMAGRVIGINTAIASSSGGNEGIGFSIPSNLVRLVANNLFEFGRMRRAYLGVQLDPRFEIGAAERLRLSRLQGARVAKVFPGTPASRADLRIDDVILNFNGTDVADESHLINLVSLTPVGERVPVVIWRDKRRQTVSVQLDVERDAPATAGVDVPREPGMGTYFHPMGLTFSSLDSAIARQLGFDASARGLLVLKVDRNGPLSDEVRVYDLVVEVATQPVGSVEDLQRILDEQFDDRLLPVRIQRLEGSEARSKVVIFRR